MAIAANRVVLEPAAQELVESTANHPFLFELGPDESRATLNDLRPATSPNLRSTRSGPPSRAGRPVLSMSASSGHAARAGRCRS